MVLRAFAHLILVTTIKKRYYCFLHFLDEELGYREIKSLVQCHTINEWYN